MIQHEDRYRDMKGSRSSMIRAARRAADMAKLHGQPLLLWRDGQVIRVMPDKLPNLPDRAPRK